jgi:hypothetical protein
MNYASARQSRAGSLSGRRTETRDASLATLGCGSNTLDHVAFWVENGIIADFATAWHAHHRPAGRLRWLAPARRGKLTLFDAQDRARRVSSTLRCASARSRPVGSSFPVELRCVESAGPVTSTSLSRSWRQIDVCGGVPDYILCHDAGTASARAAART